MASAGITTTQLDIKVNARELNRLDQKLRKTFKRDTTRDFNKALAELTKQVQVTIREFKKLNEAIVGSKKGVSEYKNLKNTLREAKTEAAALRRELERLAKAGGGAGGAPGAGFGGGGFGGGAGGAAGSGGHAGQSASRGGAGGGAAKMGLLARASRRTKGVRSYQMPAPSGQAMAELFSTIPIVGGVMGGALMFAHQNYGNWVQHQGARRDTYALLGGRGAGGFAGRLGVTPASHAKISASQLAAIQARLTKKQRAAIIAGVGDAGTVGGQGTRSVQRGTREVSTGVSFGGGLARDLQAAEMGVNSGFTPPAMAAIGGDRILDRIPGARGAVADVFGGAAEAAEKAGFGTTAGINKTKTVPNMVNEKYTKAIPDLYFTSKGMDPDGPAAQAVRAARDRGAGTEEVQAILSNMSDKDLKVNAAAAARRAAMQARWAANYRNNESTADLELVGRRWGRTNPEALQRAFGQAQGLGKRPNKSQYDFAEMMNTGYGVEMGTTGMFMKGVTGTQRDTRYANLGSKDDPSWKKVAGKREDARHVMARALYAAVVSGLRDSEATEYLKDMAGAMQKQYSLGLEKGDPTGFMRTMLRLSGAGVAGQVASRMSLSFGAGVSQVGYRGGVSNPMEFALMRSTGWEPGTGLHGMAVGKQKLQRAGGGLGSDEIMAKFIAQHKVGGFSPLVQSMFMQQGFQGIPGMGDISMSQAGHALGYGEPGAEQYAAGISTVGRDIIPRMRKSARPVSALSTMRTAAGLDAARADAGRQAQGQVVALQKTMLNLSNAVQKVLGPALNKLTDKIEKMTAAFNKILDGGMSLKDIFKLFK